MFGGQPEDVRQQSVYGRSSLSNGREVGRESEDSGFGVELLMETQDEAPWALTTVRWFTAYHLLLCHGRMPGDPLSAWDRLKLGMPVDRAESALQAMVFIPAPHFPGPQQLPSGRFDFLQLLPVTLDEHAFGREHGFEAVLAQLSAAGAAPVVDPARGSIVG